MSSAFVSYFPDPLDLTALGGLLVLAVAFAGLGSLLGSRHVSSDAILVSGWGCVVLAATIFGAVSAESLLWILYPAIALGLVAAMFVVWARPPEVGNASRLLIIGAPMLLVMAAASASQWDEFAHWLVNQRYLVDNGTFPRRGLPESTTNFAAYPYALPLVGFITTQLVGNFVENAGALFNTLLVLVMARCAVRAFRTGAGEADVRVGWKAAAAGFIAATLLNPTFVPKLVFTTYADWSTAVVVGVAVLSGWRLLEASAIGNDASARAIATHFGFALTVVVSLKQPNVLLAVLLLAGLAAAALAAPCLFRHLLNLLPRILLPPILGYAAWRYHVSTQLPGREFAFMALSEWLWSDLGSILGRMALIASKKGGYFGLMLVVVGIAAHAAVSHLRHRPISPLGRFAIFVAVPFLGYNAFLYVAYVGSFGTGEGNAAASYWRYNTQLGGAALVFAAASAGVLFHRFGSRLVLPRTIAPIVVPIAMAMAIVLAPKLRFDLNPVTRYVRAVGVEMTGLLPSGSRLIVIDPADNGKRALLLRYETYRTAQVERLGQVDLTDIGAVQSTLNGLRSAYVWVHVPTPILVQAFAVEMVEHSSYLLQAKEVGWSIVRSWPYLGYADPLSEED